MKKTSKVIYPDVNYAARTNKSFRNKDDLKHYMGKSPLEKIKPAINMTTNFILDFMHLACVGVMKKLLEILMYGSNLNIRLSPIQKDFAKASSFTITTTVRVSKKNQINFLRSSVESYRVPRSFYCIAVLLFCEVFFPNIYTGTSYYCILHSEFYVLIDLHSV